MSGIVGQNTGRGSGLVKKTAVSADSVTGSEIADDAIDSEHYTDGSIDNAHIADNAIDSEHYADGSIDNAHIADDAIDSEHYAAGSIDNAHLADDAVDSDELAAGAVDTAHIADNQITLAKMAGGTDGNIISYDASGDPVAIATGSDGQVLTSTGAGSPPAFEAAGSGGKILQIVNRQTATALTITSTTPQATDCYATITPSASSSDLYCTMSFRMQEYTTSGTGAGAVSTLQVFRDIGDAGFATIYPSTQYANMGFSTNLTAFEMSHYYQPTVSFWDDPGTTSAVTYKLYLGISLTGTNTYFVSPSPGGDMTTIFEIDGS